MIPAIQASRNGRVVALAGRRADAAAAMAREHSIRRVYDAYERLLEDAESGLTLTMRGRLLADEIFVRMV